MVKKRTGLRRLLIIILIFALAAALFGALGGFDWARRAVNSARARAKLDEAGLRTAMADMLKANPEAEDFVNGFEEIRDYDLTLDLTSQLERGEIPYLTQYDPRWGYCQYGDGLLGWTGCGPTALSMVAMGLTGDGTLTPAYVADLSINEGYCVAGDGTSWKLFSQGAEKLGLTAKELILWEPTVREELAAGRPVICIMGPGHFTSSGHYIVLVSCDEEGFQVYDPYRIKNSRTWPWSDLEGEIRNLWSYQVSEAK